jgi:hypothetical protein
MGASKWGVKELYVPEKNDPIFINIDSRLVKKHNLWKDNLESGKTEPSYEIVSAILYSMGFDIKEGYNHYHETIRDVGCKTRGFKTKVYCGKLRKDFQYAKYYEGIDVLSFPLTDKEIENKEYEVVDLSEYGVEYFTDINGKGSPMTRGVGRRHGPYRKSAKMIEKQKKKDREIMDQWEKDNEDRRKNGGSRVR